MSDYYNPDADPVLIAYQNAMEVGDYEEALRISVGLNQDALSHVAQGAAQEGYAQGRQEGFAEALASQPPRSQEEQAEADARYRRFLGEPEPEAEPSAADKARAAIRAAAYDDSYEQKLKAAFRKDS